MTRDDITLPQGYELHELPPDYDGPVWIEGQLRQLAYAVCERDTALLRQALDALRIQLTAMEVAARGLFDSRATGEPVENLKAACEAIEARLEGKQ